MKNNDLSFALLSLIILAGMIVACLPDSSSNQEKVETASSSLVDSGSSTSHHSTLSAKF